MDEERIVAEGLISTSTRLSGDLVTAGRLIDQKTGSMKSVVELVDASLPIIEKARLTAQLLNDPRAQAEVLMKSLESVVSILSSSRRSVIEEHARSVGFREGMAAALNSVKETGEVKLRELDKIKSLAESDIDLEKRRKIGERPETLKVKRKASALRESMNSEDESSKSEIV